MSKREAGIRSSKSWCNFWLGLLELYFQNFPLQLNDTLTVFIHIVKQHSACSFWTLVITHGQNTQGCCREYSQWSGWSHTLPQSDPGTLASCRNTSGPPAGSSSIWQARNRAHMSRRRRWPALWQRGPAPDETGFPESSQNCGKITTNTLGLRCLRQKQVIIINRKLTISSPSHLCCLLLGRGHSLCLLPCQNVSYKKTANHTKRQ